MQDGARVAAPLARADGRERGPQAAMLDTLERLERHVAAVRTVLTTSLDVQEEFVCALRRDLSLAFLLTDQQFADLARRVADARGMQRGAGAP